MLSIFVDKAVFFFFEVFFLLVVAALSVSLVPLPLSESDSSLDDESDDVDDAESACCRFVSVVSVVADVSA